MRIISNDKLIRRNTLIGKYSLWIGTALLVGALVINLLAFSRPQDVSLITYVIAAFFVGFTLTNIGTLFNNRWGRRPDRGLAEALKGLDDRYTLYNYRLGASHVLTGPPGVIVLHPKFQVGPVTYDGKRWLNPGARRMMFGLFNPDPLGNPVAEVAGDVEAFNRFIKKRTPDLQVVPQAIIVFLNQRAEVDAKNAALPALHVKQLKDYIRKLPKDTGLSNASLTRLDAAQTAKA
jgi:hypothetical protein